MEGQRTYAQRLMALIDRKLNRTTTVPVREVLPSNTTLLPLIASIDNGDELLPFPPGYTLTDEDHIVLTFDELIQEKIFPDVMREALDQLEEAYQGPVDLEFAVQIDRSPGSDGATHNSAKHHYQFFILECRPLNQRRFKAEMKETETKEVKFKDQRRLFAMPTILPARTVEAIDFLIFVDPEPYYDIQDETRRQQIADAITALNDLLPAGRFGLIGPGRWGSLNSRLSVPVTYSDICHSSLLVEISPPYTPAPELAYGTDFFEDIVEAGIFVLGIQPTPEEGMIDWNLLRNSPNRLSFYLPRAAELEDSLRVIDLQAVAGSPLRIIIDDETNEVIAGFDMA